MKPTTLAAPALLFTLALASTALAATAASGSDELLARREAAILAAASGGSAADVAKAEDLYLQSLGRPQRFGTIAGADGKPLEPVADGLPESLRTDFLVAPLIRAMDQGVDAAQASALEAMTKRIASRQGAQPDARLAQLAAKGSRKLGGVNRQEILDMLRADRLAHPQDFLNAALVMGRSTIPDDLLLAHELAAVAATRGVPGALATFASTWDAWSATMDLPARYATDGGEIAASVAPEFRQALLSSPLPPPARGARGRSGGAAGGSTRQASAP